MKRERGMRIVIGRRRGRMESVGILVGGVHGEEERASYMGAGIAGEGEGWDNGMMG